MSSTKLAAILSKGLWVMFLNGTAENVIRNLHYAEGLLWLNKYVLPMCPIHCDTKPTQPCFNPLATIIKFNINKDGNPMVPPRQYGLVNLNSSCKQAQKRYINMIALIVCLFPQDIPFTWTLLFMIHSEMIWVYGCVAIDWNINIRYRLLQAILSVFRKLLRFTSVQ